MNTAYVDPAEEGFKLIYKLEHGPMLIRAARAGLHRLNLYHNLEHEFSVVYFAHCCAVHQQDMSASSINELMIAAMFHDHNHSGGKTNDAANIQRATSFVQSPYFQSCLPLTSLGGKVDDQYPIDRIVEMIECTEFSGNPELPFHVTPLTNAQKCLRDADLMSIYSPYGEQIIEMLWREMGHDISKMTDSNAILNLFENNSAFLRNATMYTSYGRMMKDFHLEKRIEDLYTHLDHRYFSKLKAQAASFQE